MNHEVQVTKILVVEDNPLDIELLRYSFKKEPEWRIEMVVAEDGEKAINYFRSPGCVKPDLVILDLNLPRRDGTEVLKVIRSELLLVHLPVIIFSSSPEDVIRSKVHEADLAADGYIAKPIGIELFSTLANQFRLCYERAVRSQSN